MIRRLRRKFILINMALVGVVLLAVFSLLMLSTYQQQRNESLSALRMMLNREMSMPPLRFVVGQKRLEDGGQAQTQLLPTFGVWLDGENNVIIIDAEHVDIEVDTVEQAVSQVLEKGEEGGRIPSLNLRYLTRETPGGLRIAFLDMGYEQATLTRLFFTLLVVALGALLAFFLVSLFLSGWALRPVSRAWTQQQQFVADASHELKTPLTVILANLNILSAQRDQTVAQQQKWLDNTQAETLRMKKLVDDLLFLAKSDAPGSEKRQQAEFSLSDAVLSCILPFEPIAYEQGLSFESDVAPDLSMVGDEAQMKQLVMILLDNACKFAGEKGAVSLTLSRLQDKAQLRVFNTGPGIAPEDLPRIFERFYRADSARVRTQGGYGLGLSIASRVVSAHGGKIHAASPETGGAVFTVTLPLAYRKGAA